MQKREPVGNEKYVGPTSGRSSEVQSAVATALKNALSRTSWEDLDGRLVKIEVATLTERTSGRSTEEAYLETAVKTRVLTAGARIASTDKPEIEIHVLACALGVTRTRRDFVPFYYSELVEGVADLHITAFRVKGDTRVHIRSQEVSSRSYRRKTYIFYMIGPINKEWKE